MLFEALADRAEAAGRIEDAARYVRAAEFFLAPGDPHKRAAYERFIALFDKSRPSVERHELPSPHRPLPPLRFPHPAPRGTIVVHGGFDSFIEEFDGLLSHLRDHGFTVIAFEGPGQRAPLLHCRVPMNAEWEVPTSAVLDAVARRMRDPLVEWGLMQGMLVFGVDRPSALFRRAAQMCTQPFSARVRQDVPGS